MQRRCWHHESEIPMLNRVTVAIPLEMRFLITWSFRKAQSAYRYSGPGMWIGRMSSRILRIV